MNGNDEASPTPDAWHSRLLAVTPLRRAGVVVLHAALWAGAFVLALKMRFDGSVPDDYRQLAVQTIALIVALRLIAFLLLDLFGGVWRYAGFPELEKIVAGTTLGSLSALFVETALLQRQSPRSVYLGEWMASIVLAGGARMVLRSILQRRQRRQSGARVRTLIVGAGDAGESFLRDVQRMRDGAGWSVEGFLDDDPAKRGSSIRGVKVLGSAGAASIAEHVRAREIQLVVVAMPTATGRRMREVVQACRAAGVQVKTVPALADIIGANASWSSIREIDIDDLLRRDPVQLDVAEIEDLVRAKVVLVTGAGGSIGSELCRQLLRFSPALLLLLDHDENALFQIDRELGRSFPDARVEALIGDITDAARIDDIFAGYRPAVVLHAAAHKHVAMMESNPCEAVKNNVFGTALVATAADRHGASTFVLISTDKAVRPTSVMGCTKRITEMVIQRHAEASRTRFVAVRFGNVLGSAGSVVPIFQEQIRRGGPVTVTHPEVSRYFMTIPEASQLVLQAATIGDSGEILMLDMGEPVKILDLAQDLIELSGLRAGVDVEVEFTGLKPGEKLSEDLLLESESYDRTSHPKIVVGRIAPVAGAALDSGLHRLRHAAAEGSARKTREALSAIVPEAQLAEQLEPARLYDQPRLDADDAGRPVRKLV